MQVLNTNQPPSEIDKLRVLILDDNDFDRQQLIRLIGKTGDAFEAVTCANLIEFEHELANGVIDICLVDHQLQGSTGIDAVKASVGISDVPIVMVSGREDTQTIVQSMNAGCVDYLCKQALTAERLHATIFDAISSTFYAPAFAEEVRQSTSDVMSGIANECISELKPKLSRMYRQISFIRSCHSQGLFPSPEALDEVEEHCLAIWRFFDEIDTYTQGLLSKPN